MELERTKLRSLYTAVLPLSRAQEPFFGPELGCSATGRGRAKGLILLGPYLRQGRECSRAIGKEDGKACCRGTVLILR